jgi:hypothetical protein
MKRSRPLARTDGVVTETTIDGDLLVYDLAGDVASRLNHTAALVWRSCNGRRTIGQLVSILVEELGESVDEDLVLIALDSLAETGLIVSGYEERGGAAVALSRRRFFVRAAVAGAAAVAAPIVYSVVVPTAAAARQEASG